MGTRLPYLRTLETKSKVCTESGSLATAPIRDHFTRRLISAFKVALVFMNFSAVKGSERPFVMLNKAKPVGPGVKMRNRKNDSKQLATDGCVMRLTLAEFFRLALT